jgi:hypothetical protein
MTVKNYGDYSLNKYFVKYYKGCEFEPIKDQILKRFIESQIQSAYFFYRLGRHLLDHSGFSD